MSENVLLHLASSQNEFWQSCKSMDNVSTGTKPRNVVNPLIGLICIQWIISRKDWKSEDGSALRMRSRLVISNRKYVVVWEVLFPPAKIKYLENSFKKLLQCVETCYVPDPSASPWKQHAWYWPYCPRVFYFSAEKSRMNNHPKMYMLVTVMLEC